MLCILNIYRIHVERSFANVKILNIEKDLIEKKIVEEKNNVIGKIKLFCNDLARLCPLQIRTLTNEMQNTMAKSIFSYLYLTKIQQTENGIKLIWTPKNQVIDLQHKMHEKRNEKRTRLSIS